MPIIDKNKTLLVKCTCYGHVLEISNDFWDTIDEGDEPETSFSIWNQTPFPFSFKDRIGLIWDLIRGKNLHGDDIILTQEDVKEIISFLSEKRKENENKIKSKK